MIKTNSRHNQWILKEHSRESGRLANTSKGFFLLFLGIPPCTARVPKITNIRTKQNFAPIAFFITTAELDLGKKNKLRKFLWFDPWESKPYRRTFGFWCPTFPWSLRRRIRAKYHSDIISSRSKLTNTAGRRSYLFLIDSSRVIQAFPWGQRLLHNEWQCALTAFLNGFIDYQTIYCQAR